MKPASLAWLISHEVKLSWRDFIGMMTMGRRERERTVFTVVAVGVLLMHLVAYALLASSSAQQGADRLGWLIMITGAIALSFTLMTSQGMESITRSFYVRSDLDLVFSSPIPHTRIFLVRICAITFSTGLFSLLFVAPAINVLVLLDGIHWLAAYPVTFAAASVATVAALGLTLGMFRVLGAKRTRIAAQILAAVIGATFIIGIQLAAIASLNSFSRIAFLQSDNVRLLAPPLDSAFWVPARAAMGEPLPLTIVLLVSTAMMAVAASTLARNFGEIVLAAAGVAQSNQPRKFRPGGFRSHSIASALRSKEWKLLARDHWLLSQTLMQLLYLLPPAFMLWHGFGSGGEVSALTLPVVVMAAGQLAGGLAWLAISGEDAPQLVATAPVERNAVIRAKVESVLFLITLLVSPIAAFMAFHNPIYAFQCLLGVAAASISAVAIQLWFRSQARRSDFRRRQTSSRAATFAEAFSSVFWASSIGCLAAGLYHWALTLALAACLVLFLARKFSPPTRGDFAF